VTHELGHALGLQHTFTASAMSTEAGGRATSLYNPLTADDIAGISFLYPRGNLSQSAGSIAGRITFPGGQGIHMASVVAIRAGGAAVSALTDPDGRYRIDGVPAGQVVLYAHPLPPASRAGATPGDIRLPVGQDGVSTVPADGPFDTMFYQGGQGTRNYLAATTLNINPGGLVENINLTLNRRSAYSIPSVSTYSFFDQTPIRPGYLNGCGTLLATGSGLITNGTPAAGLNVGFLGGSPILDSEGIHTYALSPAYLELKLQATGGLCGVGPRHLVFSLPNDIFVLPFGLNLVQSLPPVVGSASAGVEPGGGRSLTLSGPNLRSDTKFYLDGVPAGLLRIDGAGRAVVSLPPGVSGLRPVVSAFNPDGQNSSFIGAPVNYQYDSGDSGQVSFSPNVVQAGSETLVEINGSGGSFVDGMTTVGFGSSDVQVRRVFVLNSGRIWANVYAAPNASLGPVLPSVMNGFQLVSQPSGFQVQAASAGRPVLNSQLAGAAPNQNTISSGSTVIMNGANLTNPSITIGDRPAAIQQSTPNQVVFTIPAGLPSGPAILRFSNGADSAQIAIGIDSLLPNASNVVSPGTGDVRIR
jgi:hypothetical protein